MHGDFTAGATLARPELEHATAEPVEVVEAGLD
jgi:hypothetical protein